MNRKFHFNLLLAVITILLLSACSIGSTEETDLQGTQWKLEAYGPANSPISAVEGIETALTFGTDGQVSGNMGCNNFNGEYTQEGQKIVFGSMMSTMMACPEPQMNQESISLSILSGSVDFRLEGDVLTIDPLGINQLVLSRQ